MGWLLTYAAHSTILLVAAAVLDRWAKTDPPSRAGLWRAAALAGLFTASCSLLLSSGRQPAETAPHAVWIEADRRTTVGPEAPALARIETRVQRSATTNRSGVGLLWVWGLGVVVLFGRLMVDERARRRVVRGLRPAGPRGRRILEDVSGASMTATLWRSAEVAAPCLVDRRRIVLPDWCEDEMSDAELRGVLGHEWAHVVRRDTVWSALFQGLTTVLWFQPLNRLALARSRDAAELACDDRAVACTGDGYGLAASIARVAESLTPSAWVPDVSIFGAGGQPLEDRVRRILNPPPVRPSPRWLGPVLVLGVMAPACFLPALGPRERIRTVLAVERTLHVTDAPGPLVEVIVGTADRFVLLSSDDG